MIKRLNWELTKSDRLIYLAFIWFFVQLLCKLVDSNLANWIKLPNFGSSHSSWHGNIWLVINIRNMFRLLYDFLNFYRTFFFSPCCLGRSEKPSENVIFLHGFLSSSSFWTETVFPNLSETTKLNYRLFAVDLFGFGRSPKPRDSFYTMKDHLEKIEESVIGQFGLKSFHLVAHSMGCLIALALAAKYSNSVKTITLVAPVSYNPVSTNAFSFLFFFFYFNLWIELLLCQNTKHTKDLS